jgi:thymidylate kinase
VKASPSGERELQAVLELLGARVAVLHPLASRADGGWGGGDVDCAVTGLDPWWPLRLARPWRLCQCLRYDITGWYWVLDAAGTTVAVDTLDDPRGIGRYLFPSVEAHGPGSAPAGPRAAYLTLKRLRKGATPSEEWVKIADLAVTDPENYRRLLGGALGDRLGGRVADLVLAGRSPDEQVGRSAGLAMVWRRLHTPGRAMPAIGREVARMIERLVRPSGFFVILAGPDGAGKTTLAEGLEERLRELFRRRRRWHWRPAVLPRPGRIVRREMSDPRDPHGRPAHGRLLSLALLLYYWLDFTLASWFIIWPFRARTGLVLVERGWWDLAVDPARYRLRVPLRLVRTMGRCLLPPDLVIVLEAPPDALLARKAEIARRELERQGRAWRDVLPHAVPRVHINASRSISEVAAAAREEVVRRLEARAIARLGPGWVGLPERGDPRWLLPRGPRKVAKAALAVYQPVTVGGRVGWEVARLLAAVGAFRVMPRGQAPPSEVRERLAPHVPAGATYAVARGNEPGRYVALLVERGGEPLAVAKIALTPAARAALGREANALERLRSFLPPPLQAPEVRLVEDGLLLLEAVSWRPRAHSWRLPEEVAAALGAFFRAGAGLDGLGPAHGDCAPWNLLRTDDRWVLCDWEEAFEGAPAFFDVFHYLVQSHALLGRPRHRTLLAGLRGDGWVGRVLRAYAEAAGIRPEAAGAAFGSYLRVSTAALDVSRADGRRGFAARARLLGALDRSGAVRS